MALERRLGLAQATALNLIDMVGIGPFIVMSSVMAAMQGPQCVLAWLIGAFLASADAMVWAELGAAMPRAGGSYVFLRSLWGSKEWGQVMGFLFIWQTVFQSSFVVASGAIGFVNYAQYLFALEWWQGKLLSVAVVVVIVTALYRRIGTIGNISIGLSFIVALTLLLVISAGLAVGDWSFLTVLPQSMMKFDGLSEAMQSTVYAILGYYNVCHLGAEIRDPERVIPQSMFISIGVITLLYVAMQLSVLSVIPASYAEPDQFIVSIVLERAFGPDIAIIGTGLVLIVALSSLYSVVLGYSRIPYAAACDGNFFRVFARLHPTKNFPHISLLAIGVISIVITLLLDGLRLVVASILTLRILVQFVGQAVGLLVYHHRNGYERFPFRMWLYPLPALIAIMLWVWLFFSRSPQAIANGLVILGMGMIVYLFIARRREWFPWQPAYSSSTQKQ